MANVDVGNLNVKIGMDTSTIKADATSVINIMQDVDTKVRVSATQRAKLLDQLFSESSNSASSALGKGFGANTSQVTQHLRQAGFALQDFSSQMTNSKNLADGLGRGIGAITNNLQMMGGPTVAIGAAIGGIILPSVIKWGAEIVNVVGGLDDAEKKLDAIAKKSEELAPKFEGFAKAAGARTGKSAREQAESLIGDRTSLARQAQAVRAELAEAMSKAESEAAKGKDKDAQQSILKSHQPEIEALKKKLNELGDEYDKADKKYQAFQKVWSPGAIARSEAITEATKAEEKAKKDREKEQEKSTKEEQKRFDKEADEHFKFIAKRDKAEEDIRRKADEGYGTDLEKFEAKNKRERNALLEQKVSPDTVSRFDKMAGLEREKILGNDKAEELRRELDEARKLGTNPNGSSSASIFGSSAAASAINRAASGANSIERDNKRKIKLLEEHLKAQQETNRKLNFQKVSMSG